MQPISHKYNSYIPKEINVIEKEQNWNKLISAIEYNPDLLITEEGESLLFLAALQFVENNDSEAGRFIKKAFSLSKEHKIPLDINASPSEGPHKGKSIFWLLSYRYFESSSESIGIEVSEINFDDFKSGEDNIFSQELLMNCLSLNCNVNASPKEGPFKDITAYGFLIFDPELFFHPALYSQIICDSQISQLVNNMPSGTLIGSLLSILSQIESDAKCFKDMINDMMNDRFEGEKQYSDEEIQQILDTCYHSLFKIIEDNPNCSLDMIQHNVRSESSEEEHSSESSDSDEYHSFVEVPLSKPSSPNRDKLLLYFIFAGAKISDNAKQESKDTYNANLKKLNSVFDRVSKVYKYNLLEEKLPTELWIGIGLNVILTEFPDLQNFSPRFLLEKFARGFK